MGSFDRVPSLVGEMRTLRSRIAEVERQRLGVARQQQAWSAQIANGSVTLPTGFGNVPQCDLTIDLGPFVGPLLVTWNCQLVSNHFSAGWKLVNTRLVVNGDVVYSTYSQSTLHDNADDTSVSTQAVLTGYSGLTRFTMQWGVTLQSAGMSGLPNPVNPSESAQPGWRGFSIVRLGALA